MGQEPGHVGLLSQGRGSQEIVQTNLCPLGTSSGQRLKGQIRGVL